MSTWVLVEMEGDAGIIQFIPDQLCNLASHRLDGFRPPGSWIACTWGSGLAGWACVLEGNPASSPSPQWPVTFLKAVEGSVSEDLNQLSNNFISFFASKSSPGT